MVVNRARQSLTTCLLNSTQLSSIHWPVSKCVCGLTYCQLIGNSARQVSALSAASEAGLKRWWWWWWTIGGGDGVKKDRLMWWWRLEEVMWWREKSFLLEKLVQRREGEKECEMKVMIIFWFCWCTFLLVSSLTKVDHHHKCSGFILFFCEKSESEEWEVVCVCVFWWGKEKCLLPLLCFFTTCRLSDYEPKRANSIVCIFVALLFLCCHFCSLCCHDVRVNSNVLFVSWLVIPVLIKWPLCAFLLCFLCLALHQHRSFKGKLHKSPEKKRQRQMNMNKVILHTCRLLFLLVHFFFFCFLLIIIFISPYLLLLIEQKQQFALKEGGGRLYGNKDRN